MSEALPDYLAFYEDQRFDEWDDDLMNDICGPTLAKPVQALLITLAQIDLRMPTKDEFAEEVLHELKQLRAACLELWRKT